MHGSLLVPRSALLLALAAAALAAGCGDPEEGRALAAPGTSQQGLGASRSMKVTGVAGAVALQGHASVDTSPSGTLQLRMKGVNLPDGTGLSVSLGGLEVGTATVRSREVAASLPVGVEAGLNGSLVVKAGPTFIVVKSWD